MAHKPTAGSFSRRDNGQVLQAPARFLFDYRGYRGFVNRKKGGFGTGCISILGQERAGDWRTRRLRQDIHEQATLCLYGVLHGSLFLYPRGTLAPPS
jgi:hypothetical protein